MRAQRSICSRVILLGLLILFHPGQVRGNDDLSWIDSLNNCDGATRQMIRSIVLAARAHQSAITRVHCRYTLESREALSIDAIADSEPFRQSGMIYLDGSRLRYDMHNEGDNYPTRAKQAVLLTADLFVETRWDNDYGPVFILSLPPTRHDWPRTHRGNMSFLDPRIHIGSMSEVPLEDALKEGLSKHEKITMRNDGAKVTLAATLAGAPQFSSEYYFDGDNELVPLGWSAATQENGEMTNGRRFTYEWQKIDEKLYPKLMATDQFYPKHGLVRVLSVAFEEVKLNEKAAIPDGTFAIEALSLPIGTQGVDSRPEAKSKVLVLTQQGVRPKAGNVETRLPASVLREIEQIHQEKEADREAHAERHRRRAFWFRVVATTSAVCAVLGVVAAMFRVLRRKRAAA